MNKEVDFLLCYLGTLGSSLLRNMLAGKGVVAMRQRKDGGSQSRYRSCSQSW